MEENFGDFRDNIAQALMEQQMVGSPTVSDRDLATARDAQIQQGLAPPSFQGTAGSPTVSDRDLAIARDAQIQQNAAPPGFQGMAGSPTVSDRDLAIARDAQIQRNLAPPSFKGAAGSPKISERDLIEAAKAAQEPFQARPAPVFNAPVLARGANSPPLPAWVGRFAAPSYPYGRKR